MRLGAGTRDEGIRGRSKATGWLEWLVRDARHFLRLHKFTGRASWREWRHSPPPSPLADTRPCYARRARAAANVAAPNPQPTSAPQASTSNFTPTGDFTFTSPSGSSTRPTNGFARNGSGYSAPGASTSDEDDESGSEEESSEEDEAEQEQEKPDSELTGAERLARALEKKELGNLAYKRSDYPSATRFYSHAIELDPSNPSYFLNRAAARMGSKLFSAALDDCLAAQGLQKNDPQSKTLLRTAKCQLALGLTSHAQQTLHEAFRLDPSNRAIATEKNRADRVATHVSNIRRDIEKKDWSMVLLGVDAAVRECEAEVTPKEWRVWKLEALIGKKRYDEAASLAACVSLFFRLSLRPRGADIRRRSRPQRSPAPGLEAARSSLLPRPVPLPLRLERPGDQALPRSAAERPGLLKSAVSTVHRIRVRELFGARLSVGIVELIAHSALLLGSQNPPQAHPPCRLSQRSRQRGVQGATDGRGDPEVHRRDGGGPGERVDEGDVAEQQGCGASEGESPEAPALTSSPQAGESERVITVLQVTHTVSLLAGQVVRVRHRRLHRLPRRQLDLLQGVPDTRARTPRARRLGGGRHRLQAGLRPRARGQQRRGAAEEGGQGGRAEAQAE